MSSLDTEKELLEEAREKELLEARERIQELETKLMQSQTFVGTLLVTNLKLQTKMEQKQSNEESLPSSDPTPSSEKRKSEDLGTEPEESPQNKKPKIPDHQFPNGEWMSFEFEDPTSDMPMSDTSEELEAEEDEIPTEDTNITSGKSQLQRSDEHNSPLGTANTFDEETEQAAKSKEPGQSTKTTGKIPERRNKPRGIMKTTGGKAQASAGDKGKTKNVKFQDSTTITGEEPQASGSGDGNDKAAEEQAEVQAEVQDTDKRPICSRCKQHYQSHNAALGRCQTCYSYLHKNGRERPMAIIAKYLAKAAKK